jgi:catechol 2,3-dioxygenase-like lactoylglutathione lyase family enzyme
MLNAHDFPSALRFYTERLGFERVEGDARFAILRRGEIELRLVHCRLRQLAGGGTCILRVRDLDAWRRDLVARGILSPARRGSQESAICPCHVRDPVGNLLCFTGCTPGSG